MRRSFAILIAIVCVRPVGAHGQVGLPTDPVLVAGDTLRVVWGPSAPFGRALGSLVRLDGRALTVSEFGPITRTEKVVPLDSIRRIQVRRGWHRSVPRILVGTAVGATVGAAIGAGLAWKLSGGDDPPKYNEFGQQRIELGPIFVTVIGAGVGGGAGASAGFVIGRRETPRWITVSFRRPAVIP